jgi:glutamate dehydrogenase (NADP+)
MTGWLSGKTEGISEGANMPSTPESIDIFLDNKILYAPGKAANAGGVFVSGLEMTQNSMRLSWTKKEVNNHLKVIKKRIHQSCLDTSVEYGAPGNYVVGANIAGFVKVVDAMLDGPGACVKPAEIEQIVKKAMIKNILVPVVGTT